MTLSPQVTHLTTGRGGVSLAESDEIIYYLTACCNASAKGGQYGVICRACHNPVPDWMGDAALIHDLARVTQMLTRIIRVEDVPVIIAGIAATIRCGTCHDTLDHCPEVTR